MTWGLEWIAWGQTLAQTPSVDPNSTIWGPSSL